MKNLSIFRGFFKKVNQSLKVLQKKFHTFSLKYPRISQNIQLTFIYFFSLVDLLHSVLNNVFNLGYVPAVLDPFLPFIESILLSPFFQIWGSPEKVFFLSYVVIELMIIKSVFKFKITFFSPCFNVSLFSFVFFIFSCKIKRFSIFIFGFRLIKLGDGGYSVDNILFSFVYVFHLFSNCLTC